MKAIDNADYFILLIGARAGGWYDKDAGTTITMMEYRHAYERAKRGELKLITFVRQGVWDVREDRWALRALLKAEYAEEKGLPDEDIERIAKHQSSIVADAEPVFSFLKEVGRVEEMKAAAKGTGSLPPANWIHRFDGFRDIN